MLQKITLGLTSTRASTKSHESKFDYEGDHGIFYLKNPILNLCVFTSIIKIWNLLQSTAVNHEAARIEKKTQFCFHRHHNRMRSTSVMKWRTREMGFYLRGKRENGTKKKRKNNSKRRERREEKSKWKSLASDDGKAIARRGQFIWTKISLFYT